MDPLPRLHPDPIKLTIPYPSLEQERGEVPKRLASTEVAVTRRVSSYTTP